MQIEYVTLVVDDLDVAARYYEQVLQLPVERAGERVTVTVGSTTLELTGGTVPGTHHLAITVPSNKFSAAKKWLSARTALLDLDGADEFESSPHWNARSVYFTAADGTILELIVRHDLENATDGPFGPSDLLCISEVGIAVQDVAATVQRLSQHGVNAYGWNAWDFAPVGDVDGLLILVTAGRTWFPTDRVAALTPISVTAKSTRDATLDLPPSARQVLH